jgi:RHS repeat-associated protein
MRGSGGALARLSYDADGRLCRCEQLASGLAVELVYDYEGERVAKRVTELGSGALVSETRYLGRWVTFEAGPAGAGLWTGARQFILDGKETLAVVDASGSLSATVHPDHLGSTGLVADATGGSETIDYRPFGEETKPASAAWLRRRFGGKETDAELGLVSFGPRFYLPALGRWCAPDPELWSSPETHLANPQNLNAYSYAVNNPVTLSDPTGRSPGKYAGDYIDTRRILQESVRRPDGAVELVTYRIVEAKPGTWLSKITCDFGWGGAYSKQQGYGAYDRSIIRPLNTYAAAASGFRPDHIQPGQFFAVRERASTIWIDIEHDDPIQGDVPKQFSKDWSWKTVFGAGGSLPIGGEAQTFAFRNDRTGQVTHFTYLGFGGGPGLPISIAMPSDDWAKMPRLDHAIQVKDFEGSAQHFSAGAAYGFDRFVLQGPYRNGFTDKPLTLESSGFGGSVGVGFTSGTLVKR